MKVFLESIGCRLNQAEIDRYASELASHGHIIVKTAADADLVIINTCSVTAAAASDSRSRVRSAARNPNAKIVVTGCWSEMERTKASGISGVVQVVSNLEKDTLVRGLRPIFGMDTVDGAEVEANKALPVHAAGRTRSFIKVQDGCDNFCTFCVTRLARGKARSEDAAAILREIQCVEAAGGQEVVLTGVNLGAWGTDLHPKRTLAELLRLILAETSIRRIRLSSLENWDLDLDFAALWENRRLMPHFHLPLQSGSPSVLKRMARRTKPESFLALMDEVRRVRDGFSITTDIIVGFPGETADEFKETLDFVDRARFSGGHVFPFSPRPLTAAEKLLGALSKEVKHERSKLLRERIQVYQTAFLMSQVGTSQEILWEHPVDLGNGRYLNRGLTANYLPVQAEADQDWFNTITRETISGVNNGVLAIL